MVALIVWTAVILLAVVGIAITMSLGQGTWTGGVLSQMPMRVAVLASAAVALILLGGLWKVRSLAEADAAVVEKLADKSRGHARDTDERIHDHRGRHPVPGHRWHAGRPGPPAGASPHLVLRASDPRPGRARDSGRNGQRLPRLHHRKPVAGHPGRRHRDHSLRLGRAALEHVPGRCLHVALDGRAR